MTEAPFKPGDLVRVDPSKFQSFEEFEISGLMRSHIYTVAYCYDFDTINQVVAFKEITKVLVLSKVLIRVITQTEISKKENKILWDDIVNLSSRYNR